MDVVIFDFFQSIRWNWLNAIMVNASLIGNAGFIWIIIGVLLLLFPLYRTKGIYYLIVLLITGLIIDFLKNIIARQRPFMVMNQDILIPPPSSYSFPSGHTTISFAAAMILHFYFPRLRIYIWTLAGLISISRIYVGVHYPFDVLAGIILGIVIGLISLKSETMMRRVSLK